MLTINCQCQCLCQVLLSCYLYKDLELDGHTASLEIWVDRTKSDQVVGTTVIRARHFCWRKGPVTVHIHGENVGILGKDDFRMNIGPILCLSSNVLTVISLPDFHDH